MSDSKDNIKLKRTLLFLCGCILTRCILVYLAKTVSDTYLRYMSYPALAIGIGFLYIYFIGSETADRQLEWAGDRVWWNSLRVVHGCLYLLFAYLAYTGNRCAWYVLLVDVIIGFLSWLNRSIHL